MIGVRREEAAPCFLAQCQGSNIRWAGEEGREGGREGKSRMFLLPQAAGWRSLERQRELCTPKLALEALKEHHFPVV